LVLAAWLPALASRILLLLLARLLLAALLARLLTALLLAALLLATLLLATLLLAALVLTGVALVALILVITTHGISPVGGTIPLITKRIDPDLVPSRAGRSRPRGSRASD
jgi:hypothetical protein